MFLIINSTIKAITITVTVFTAASTIATTFITAIIFAHITTCIFATAATISFAAIWASFTSTNIFTTIIYIATAIRTSIPTIWTAFLTTKVVTGAIFWRTKISNQTVQIIQSYIDNVEATVSHSIFISARACPTSQNFKYEDKQYKEREEDYNHNEFEYVVKYGIPFIN